MASTHLTMSAGSIATAAHDEPHRNVFGDLWSVLAARFATPAPSRSESRIERFIQENGGELTDELEREISRRFGTLVE